MTSDTTPGDGGSAGRRVVRSALELLAETASPELLGRRAAAVAAKTPAKFTVVRAAAPPPSPGVTAPPQQQKREEQQRWVSALPDGAGGGAVMATGAEEPSTLLFLSPAAAAGKGGDSAVKKRLFKKKKKSVRLSDSAKKAAAMREFLHLAEAPEKEEEEMSKEEMEREATVVVTRKGNISHDKNALLSRSEPLFTEEEVQQRISEALRVYELRRDAEEESVLQEVGNEIELQNVRYEKLLQEKSAIEEERDALQAKMEQFALQCEALRTTIASLHHELEEERKKVSRVEVELCHAQDEKRLASSGMQQELNFEKAQWKLAQEEMQRQINEFEAQLRTRTFEWHELQETLREAESERARLLEQLEASQAELAKWQERHREMETAKAEQQELVPAKEALVRQLQQKLREAEKALKSSVTSTRDEQTQLASRLRSVEEALQQQTDEVRRKMHRVHVLEAEQAKVERVNKLLRRAVREAVSRFLNIHSTLETLVESFRTTRHIQSSHTGLRDALFSAKATAVDSHETQDFFVNDVDALSGVGEGEEVDDSLLELVVCKELRDDLRASHLFSKRIGPVLRQQPEPNIQRLRNDKPSVSTKKGAIADADEVEESHRLQRCHQQCERLLETLQRLFLERQRRFQRQAQRIAMKRDEENRAEVTRCQEALLACQANLEESRRQEKLLRDECRQRCDEAQRLGSRLVELQAGEQDAALQKKRLMERIEELQHERGVLRLQLEASQQDCAGLRERNETICSEAEAVRERLSLLENSQRIQAETMEAKAKVQASLARCTAKLKKTEGECQALRSENEVLLNKMKSTLSQLQTVRMRQSGKNTVLLAQKHVEQKEQREELGTLTKELGELRKLQKSSAAQHAKERAEAELLLKKLREGNEGLRAELVQGQQALVDARNEMEMQRHAETAMLRTLLSIYESSSKMTTDDVFAEDGGDEVQQRLFDATPVPHAEDRTSTSRVEVTTADLRGRVVSRAQRTVLELARLREALSQARRSEADSRLGAFCEAERVAKEAAQRSALRGKLCVDRGGDFTSPARPRSSPSPRKIGGETTHVGVSPCRHSTTFVAVNALKSAREKERSVARNVLSSLRTSTGGVSRSRSTQGVLDGSCSPARPPMLCAPSVR